MSLTCPKCCTVLNMKYFDGGYWVASKDPVWTCSSCNTFYRAKELKKSLCSV
ncbi:hypothetical protein NTE_00559 [Candidatus Nitrososphaera evergladensis SR1]|jgi:RNase P subunit RPR2|uniref:Uncharacterized protein n=1 Tax=Candidatus Nitrososphaera evergladensis SR1 TaxID=1459636 RepID=A0A075MNA7_9ARCH|nr:hypothetical protein NTE_00559 [Candidatus Nitrososphaera evergladensis SR1]